MLVIFCSKFYVQASLAWFLTSAFSGEFWFILRFQDHWISFVGLVYHRIHVWYIHLHLVDVYGKCRYINIPYMDPMGNYIIILIRARLCLANMCWRHVWIESLQRVQTALWWRFFLPGAPVATTLPFLETLYSEPAETQGALPAKFVACVSREDETHRVCRFFSPRSCSSCSGFQGCHHKTSHLKALELETTENRRTHSQVLQAILLEKWCESNRLSISLFVQFLGLKT